MKVYPVTEFELWALGSVGLAASIFFSFAAGLLNFYLDTARELALSPDILPEVAAQWTERTRFAIWGALAAFVVGLLLIVGGAIGIARIKKRTAFQAE